MAGNNATFEQGTRKAILAPFRTIIFLSIAAFVLLVGRMVIDFTYTGSDPIKVEALRSSLWSEIDASLDLPPVLGDTTERALKWAAAAYEIVYVYTGLDRSLVATPADFTEPEKALRRGLDAAASQPHWQAMMLGTQLIAVRVALLPSLLPLLILTWALALSDGAVSRWIRRAAGGRESSTIYHRAKYMHVVVATVLLVAWLWLPFSVSLWTFGLSLALLGGALLRIQLMFYKKYI